MSIQRYAVQANNTARFLGGVEACRRSLQGRVTQHLRRDRANEFWVSPHSMNDKQQAQIYSEGDRKSSSAGVIAFYFSTDRRSHSLCGCDN